MEEQDTHKAAVIFHPKAIKVAQFKANLFSTEAKEPDAVTQEAKRQKIAAQQEEQCKDMDHELAVLAEIQKDKNTPEQEAILRCFGEIVGVFMGSPAKALLWSILLGFDPSFP